MSAVLCLLLSVLLSLPAAAELTNAPPAAPVSHAPVSQTNAPPAAIAPAWRAFSAKCADGTVTRTDLIVFKRFIAMVALDDAEKRYWTAKARQLYRQGRKST